MQEKNASSFHHYMILVARRLGDRETSMATIQRPRPAESLAPIFTQVQSLLLLLSLLKSHLFITNYICIYARVCDCKICLACVHGSVSIVSHSSHPFMHLSFSHRVNRPNKAHSMLHAVLVPISLSHSHARTLHSHCTHHHHRPQQHQHRRQVYAA
jgi:hypothetical protein